MLSEAQTRKYKVNIFRVRGIPTIHVLSVASLAPVFAQLIQTSDWHQNSGVRLVFGLSERQMQKVKSPNQTCRSVKQTAIFSVLRWEPLVRLTSVWRQWRTHYNSFSTSRRLTASGCPASWIISTHLLLLHTWLSVAIRTLQATGSEISYVGHVSNRFIGRHTGCVCGIDRRRSDCSNILDLSVATFNTNNLSKYRDKLLYST